MVSQAPPFWWEKAGWQAYALSPISYLYGKVAGMRMRNSNRDSVPVPVICVGNFTVGGAGKTPTSIAMARAAIAMGLKPGFLSRGYGGTLDVTTLVDINQHKASDVGDEPLLLAREATTVISRKRIDGARKLVDVGVNLIIMDDGFQSARLVLDYALLVVDTNRGIGNGHLIPGGPVRAPLGEQLLQTSAVLKVGVGSAADELVRICARAGKQIFVSGVKPRLIDGFSGKRVLAFAGIADPTKFYRTAKELGADVVIEKSFPDHHYFKDEEIRDLLLIAKQHDLEFATTAKDAVRLSGQGDKALELLNKSTIVEIDMVFDSPDALSTIINTAIDKCRDRLLRP